MKTALLSVSDKTGIVKLAKDLDDLGYRLVSTGGTLEVLKKNGLNVISVSEVTGFPEILDGRVKTLHPAVHGGLLALRDDEDHMKTIEKHGIRTIDLVCVNLYPFEETIKKEGATLEMAIENIDIGGPSMLRSASKNYRSVTVLSDPEDYDAVVEALKSGVDMHEINMRLAVKAFAMTCNYDKAIFSYLNSIISKENEAVSDKSNGEKFGDTEVLELKKIAELRYGENPDQAACLYSNPLYPKGIAEAKILHGKAMSYNNFLDANAACLCLRDFDEPAAVCLKHATPCGVAVSDKIEFALEKAIAADPVSVFGGIIALNRKLNVEAARKISAIFCEIVVAPSFEDEALSILKEKKNLRIIELDVNEIESGTEIRGISGGILIQEEDSGLYDELEQVTELAPTEEELGDLIFALKVVKHAKSNAIVTAKGGVTLGIGTGQVNRLWSTENAVNHSAVDVRGGVLASDAFFPFPDGVEAAAKAGITAIIQPGGSVKDKEVIEAANRLGIKMVFCKKRHFKH